MFVQGMVLSISLYEAGDPYVKVFQDEVRSLSLKSWPSFGPVVRMSRGGLHGYDSKLQRWNSIDNVERGDDVIMAGSLKFKIAAKGGKSVLKRNYEVALILRVENIISKRFKVMDVPPLDEDNQIWCNMGEAFHVTSDGFVAAILSFCYSNENDEVLAIRLYDSKKTNWEVRYYRDPIGLQDRFLNPIDFEVCSTCSQDAKILMMYQSYPRVFARYDIVTGAWDNVQLFDIASEWSLRAFWLHPVICGSRVKQLNEYNNLNMDFIPPVDLSMSGDEDHLYIGLNRRALETECRIYSFHLIDRTWSSVPIPDKNNRRIGCKWVISTLD